MNRDNSAPTLESWLKDQPFTLSLSSGFFGFFAHLGLLMALEKKDIRPAKITGASAGALTAACYAAGLSCEQIADYFFSIKRTDFWDPGIGFGLLKGKKMRSLLENLLPVDSIEDCRIPLYIAVYQLLARKSVILSKGDLASSVVASCALPILFQPAIIEKKVYIDGGTKDPFGLNAVNDKERLLVHSLCHCPKGAVWGAIRKKTSAKQSISLMIPSNLPPVGPFKLYLGIKACQIAKEQALYLLDRPYKDSLILDN